MLKLIRLLLGSIIAALDWVTRGSKLKRTSEAQNKVEEEIKALSIYQFRLCPFCIKTRRTLHKLNLPISLMDAKNDINARETLSEGGGKIKVPCLRIENNNETIWMYESNDIIKYLTQRFA